MVLVAEPLPVGLSLPHLQAGVVHHDVVGVGQTHGEEHRGRIQLVDGGTEHRGHLVGCRAIGRRQILVVGKLEPAVLRLQHGHRGDVLLAPHGDDVVAGDEAPQGVPLGRHLGVGGRPAPSTVTTVVSG